MGPHFSLYARIAAWAAVFLLAVWSIHLDNRLKRSIRIALGNPGLTQRILQMSAASRFQTAWRNRLPKSAEPMTFYRPERLYALGQGWDPVVALHSPSFVRLFAQSKGAAQLEKVLAKRGITHFYFETDPEEPEFSVYYDQLVAGSRSENLFGGLRATKCTPSNKNPANKLHSQTNRQSAPKHPLRLQPNFNREKRIIRGLNEKNGRTVRAWNSGSNTDTEKGTHKIAKVYSALTISAYRQ